MSVTVDYYSIQYAQLKGPGLSTISDSDFPSSGTPDSGVLVLHTDTSAGQVYLSAPFGRTWHRLAGPARISPILAFLLDRSSSKRESRSLR
jgi:hypothetical protein